MSSVAEKNAWQPSSLGQNMLAMYALQIANYVIPIVTLPFLIRTLGTETYGVMAAAFATVFFMVVFVDAGSNTYAVRELARAKRDPDRIAEIYCVNMQLKLVLVTVSALALALLVLFVPAMHDNAMLYGLCFLMVIGSLNFPTWLFQGLEVMRMTLFYSVAGRVLATVGLFALIRGPEDIAIAAGLQASGTLISGLLAGPQVRRLTRTNWRAIVTTSPARLWHWIAQVRGISVSEFATQAASNSSVFLVSLFASDALTGVFAALEKLARAAASGLQPVVRVLYPRSAALWQRSRAEGHQFATRWTLRLILLSIVALVIGAWMVPWLLELLFGAGWAQYSGAMRGLLIWVFFLISSLCLSQLCLLAAGDTQSYSRILLAGAIVQVALCVPAVALFDISGATAALVFGELLKVACLLRHMRKKANHS